MLEPYLLVMNVIRIHVLLHVAGALWLVRQLRQIRHGRHVDSPVEGLRWVTLLSLTEVARIALTTVRRARRAPG